MTVFDTNVADRGIQPQAPEPAPRGPIALRQTTVRLGYLPRRSLKPEAERADQPPVGSQPEHQDTFAATLPDMEAREAFITAEHESQMSR